MKNIWCKDNTNENPLTDEYVAQVEEKLGLKLPKTYIELCKIQNGGYIKYTDLRLSEEEDDTMYVNSDLFGINERGILSSQYYIDEWNLPNNVLLLCGDGHTWIAMDYRKVKENPLIVYLDTEGLSDECEVTLIAKDFDEFLSKLFIEEDI